MLIARVVPMAENVQGTCGESLLCLQTKPPMSKVNPWDASQHGPFSDQCQVEGVHFFLSKVSILHLGTCVALKRLTGLDVNSHYIHMT